MCVCMYVRTHVCARVCVVSRHARTCCAPSFCQLHMEAFTPKQGSVGVAVPCLSHSPPLAEDAEHPITTALHAPHHPSLVRICDSRTVWHRMHTNILICKHTHLYECTLTWGCVCVCVCGCVRECAKRGVDLEDGNACQHGSLWCEEGSEGPHKVCAVRGQEETRREERRTRPEEEDETRKEYKRREDAAAHSW